MGSIELEDKQGYRHTKRNNSNNDKQLVAKIDTKHLNVAINIQ